MQQDKLLGIMLIVTAAFGIVKLRIKEKNTVNENVWNNIGKRAVFTIFYALYLAVIQYLARGTTQYLCSDFREGANHIIWIYCLAGAFIWFPIYTKDSRSSSWKNPSFIFGEVIKHIAFLIITVLAFCTQELERLHISTIGTGIMVLTVYTVFKLINYKYKGKERKLNLHDIFYLFFVACILWYLGVSVYNTNVRAVLTYIPINILSTFVPMLILLFITADWNMTIYISIVLNFIWTLAHYFVFQFRGSVLIPGDIFSIGTAATVAGEYKYSMNTDIWWLCMGSVLILMYAGNIHNIKVQNRRHTFRIVGTTISCIAVLLWYNSDFINNMHLPYYTGWFQPDMYHHVGYTMGFIEVMKCSKVIAPDNYSDDYVEALALEYSPDTDDESNIKPDIIVIMNESYSDMSDMCGFDTNIDCMEYYHSLTTSKDTAVGRTLVSTIGGNTSKSEYEFLTGNSQEFLPDTVAYTTEIYDDIYSIVSTLKSQGYHAMATHPNVGSNWKRNSVYKYMQFDDMKFIEDYENSELLRGYVTDAELYRHLLSWMESRNSDEPQFVFAVTMQNHGPYKFESLKEGEDLPIIRNDVSSPAQLDAYLSLIYESDLALKELIETVDKLEKPTVVAMFGDHLPSIATNIWDELGYYGTETGLAKEEIKYATPYIVHANYDIDLSGIPEYLSVNYLGSFILKACGLKLTPYDNYLIKMQESIPAMNFMGLMTEDGDWYSYDEGMPEKYASIINEYNILQYNSRFGSTLEKMFSVGDKLFTLNSAQ